MIDKHLHTVEESIALARQTRSLESLAAVMFEHFFELHPEATVFFEGFDMSEIMPWTDGKSLVSLDDEQSTAPPVLMEYGAEASYAPLVAIRQNQWKYIHCELDPPHLFDLGNDPHELTNLATEPTHAKTAEKFAKMVHERWNMQEYDAEIRQSQARRWVVYEALRNGSYFPWDYQPLQKASERYMRNHMDLNVVEKSKRYPPE
mgnify:CR=1 FL=1